MTLFTPRTYEKQLKRDDCTCRLAWNMERDANIVQSHLELRAEQRALPTRN